MNPSHIQEARRPPLEPPAAFRSPRALVRRAFLWFSLCFICATPSFVLAAAEFDRRAMILGIVIFALGMFGMTSTTGFYRFSRMKFVRRTLYIGYGIRLAASVIVPVGAIADLFPGMISVMLVNSGMGGERFIPTLVITIVQGFLLNAILAVLMGAIWFIQMTAAPKVDVALRGCGKCGYDLVATPPGAPCPECGSTIGGDRFDSTLLSRAEWWQLLLAPMAIFAIMALIMFGMYLFTGDSVFNLL